MANIMRDPKYGLICRMRDMIGIIILWRHNIVIVPVEIFRIMYGVSYLILSISQKNAKLPMRAIVKNKSASFPKRQVIMPARPFHNAADMKSTMATIPNM